MDEVRAADAIRYLANQYASMVFVSEQLDKIGSLKGQLKSLDLRFQEASRSLDDITQKMQSAQVQAELERNEHAEASRQRTAHYADQCAAMDRELADRKAQQDVEIHSRAADAETEAQAARDAHQGHMVELNTQLLTLGTRVAQATAEAVAAEARRDRAQSAVDELQAMVASIKMGDEA